MTARAVTSPTPRERAGCLAFANCRRSDGALTARRNATVSYGLLTSVTYASASSTSTRSHSECAPMIRYAIPAEDSACCRGTVNRSDRQSARISRGSVPPAISAAIARVNPAASWRSQRKPRDPDPAARRAVGDERLRAPARVVRDAARGDREDLGPGAVVAPQDELCRARIGASEAEQVVEIGAAPAIQQLIVVAGDDKRPVWRTAAGPGETLEQHELRVIGVLELVDEDVAPAPPVATADRRIAREQHDAIRDEIGEVKRVGGAQLGLHVFPGRRDRHAVRVLRALAQVGRRPEPALGERDLRRAPPSQGRPSPRQRARPRRGRRGGRGATSSAS